MSEITAFARAASRPWIRTLAPCPASSLATYRPTPSVEPVMKTVLPFISIELHPSLRLRADAGRFDNRPPFLDFSLLERSQARGRLLLAWRNVEPEIGEALLQRRVGQRLGRRGVELGDHVFRRALWRPKTEPAGHIESFHTGLVRGRDVGHRSRALRRKIRQRLDLAGPDLRQC